MLSDDRQRIRSNRRRLQPFVSISSESDLFHVNDRNKQHVVD